MISNRTFAQFNLNKPQATVLTVMANEIWLLWARGTGKTVGVTAPWVLHKVEVMPRSCGGMIVQTFKDGESKILKPLFEAFGKMGHEKDIHYTYGKEPPKSWARPLTPIIDWKQVIAFPNGTVIQMISLHNEGSANSNSFQWIYGPEAKYLNQAQLQSEVFPTLRGHKEVFGDCPWYMAKLFETDKYSVNIHWILKKRELHNRDVTQAVIYYQLQLNALRLKMAEVEERQAYRIKRKIERITALLNQLRRNLVFVSEASAIDNAANLPDDYLENMKRSLTDYEYKVSILNEDPTKAEHSFYPKRTAEHLYYRNAHEDDDVTRPIAVAMDWQALLTPLVSCQVNDKVIPGVQSLNFLQSFFVKDPEGIPECVNLFCKYHSNRPCKEVVLYYDHTAIAKRNNAKSFYKEAQAAFIKNGWVVHLEYLGQTPYHEVKYNKINRHLAGEGAYPIRFNMEGCKSLLLSMDITGIKPGSAYEKDKSKERDKNFPQELATHFSDTFDVLAYAICEQGKYRFHSSSIAADFVGFR